MTKLSFITFDEKLEAAWGLHKIEKAVLEKEIAELRERLAEADEANRRVSDENEMLREAVAAELERCARICEDLRHPDGYSSENNIWIDATNDCAKAIRESGDEL